MPVTEGRASKSSASSQVQKFQVRNTMARKRQRILERKKSLSKLIPNRGSVRDHFHDYCNSTSIHGIKYLGDRERPFAERLSWVIIFLLCLAGNGYLIHKVWRKWNDSPVIVSFAENTTPVWQVPFPAVTICSEIKSRASVFNFSQHMVQYIENGTDPEITKKLGDVSLLCDPHVLVDGDDYADEATFEFLLEVAPSMNEAMWICKWKEYLAENCTGLFTEILTEEGVCYTFNMLDKKFLLRGDPFPNYNSVGTSSEGWTLDEGYSKDTPLDAYPYRALAAGAKAGLFVVVRAKMKDSDYYCRGPVAGFKVLLHNPAEFPNVGERYLRVPLNQEVIAVIQPQIMTTSEGLLTYPPVRRGCYFQSERYLQFFKIYTQRNCELECLANYTLKSCGCVALHMPRNEDTPVCGPGKKACILEAGKELLHKEITSSYQSQMAGACHCLQACTSITYNAESSQAQYDTYSTLSAYEENVTEEYQGIGAARISIFFKEMQFTTSRRSELFGIVDFLANCGGLLGLCCGVSFLSIVELVYYITLRFWGNVKRSRKKDNPKEKDEVKSDELGKLENANYRV